MKARAPLVLVFVLVGIITLGTLAGYPRPVAITQSPKLAAQATQVTVSYNGIGPSSISLTWTQTQDACFTNYTLEYSTVGSSGPWTYLGTISSSSTLSTWVRYLSPGQTYWWTIVDYDCLGHTFSVALQKTQPAASSATASLSTETSASVSWTNNAQYGGSIAFQSYVLYESANGGSYSALTTITSAAVKSYVVQSLSPGTAYSFYVVTTDALSGGYVAVSYSTTASVTAPYPPTATASASRSSVDAGQSVTFSCSGSAGVAPYSYSWAFSDGGSGSGASVSHSYTTAGTANAVCTVTDRYGATATQTVSTTVYALPTVSLSASSDSVLQGSQLVLTATPQGGSGGLTYSWSGLPQGCTSANGASITCAPSQSGTFTVKVTVTDSNDGSATDTVTVTVTSSVGGMPSTQGYLVYGGLVVIVLIVAVAIALYVVRSRRKRQSTAPPGNLPPPPPPGA